MSTKTNVGLSGLLNRKKGKELIGSLLNFISMPEKNGEKLF